MEKRTKKGHDFYECLRMRKTLRPVRLFIRYEYRTDLVIICKKSISSHHSTIYSSVTSKKNVSFQQSQVERKEMRRGVPFLSHHHTHTRVLAYHTSKSRSTHGSFSLSLPLGKKESERSGHGAFSSPHSVPRVKKDRAHTHDTTRLLSFERTGRGIYTSE